MYSTANNAEDLNIVDELHSFPGVSYVAENYQIDEKEYRDADYQIFLVNRDGVEQINELLSQFGMKAYCDDDEVFKAGYWPDEAEASDPANETNKRDKIIARCEAEITAEEKKKKEADEKIAALEKRIEEVRKTPLNLLPDLLQY